MHQNIVMEIIINRKNLVNDFVGSVLCKYKQEMLSQISQINTYLHNIIIILSLKIKQIDYTIII